MATPTDLPSGNSTPRSFTAQGASAEDLLKSQTVGLVNLDDFRKRRADALEAKEKEAHDKSSGRFRPSTSGASTPVLRGGSDGALTPKDDSGTEPPRKKKKKAAKGLLSFGLDEEDFASVGNTPAIGTPQATRSTTPSDSLAWDGASVSRKLTPNPNAALPAPKIITKAALQAEQATRDKLRQEYLAIQEAVKATEVQVPFVFYDGTNIPGGNVKMKKGDHIWLFLDKCRKMGADLGVGGKGDGSESGTSKAKNDARREWARVGVDDLMCVRGEVIVPQHYELYYFIANKVPNPSKIGGLLFDYSNTMPKDEPEESKVLRVPGQEKLEGRDHDPALTKVVDRRWYEKNKHIFPASIWKEYKAGDEFSEETSKMKRDAEGNAFFFS